jgi:hypothetical protein
MNTSIPEPSSSEVGGTQLPGSADRPFIESELVESPMEGLTIAGTVQGLAASNPRSFGGEVTAKIIAGTISETLRQLTTEKRDHALTRATLDCVRAELTDERISSATISERLRSTARIRHFSNFGVAAGSAIVGFGIELSNSPGSTPMGTTLVALGLCMIILCFFLSPSNSQK